MSKVCVVVPTYNNAATLQGVVESLLAYTNDVLVVDDGSTDSTTEAIRVLGDRITALGYPTNRGKGYALRTAFRRAAELGFDYAITIDADGQHSAKDLAAFIDAIERHPGALIVGSRGFDHKHMPAKNSFANKFSNFWFRIHTLSRLPDTQSGYRAYPLAQVAAMRLVTTRYETETELLVRSAWRGVPILPVAIGVHYPPAEERVSHFRPFRDFVRISVLNTALSLGAVFYGYPSILIRRITQTW